MSFGIEPDHYETLKRIVIAPLQAQGAKVWLFGSRATGRYKKFSDVDILYEFETKNTLPPGFLFLIRTELEDSNFPYKLDLVDRKNLAASYKDQIEREKRPL